MSPSGWFPILSVELASRRFIFRQNIMELKVIKPVASFTRGQREREREREHDE